MGVSARASRYQQILYGINGVVFVMAAVALGYAAWALHSNQSFALPTWAIKLGLSFSVIVVVISGAGFYGSYVAPNRIANHQTNWALWFYFILVFTSVILTTVAAGVVLVLADTIKDTQDQKATKAVEDFERNLRESMDDHPSEWVDVQNYFDCCGYDCSTASLSVVPANCTDRATGENCPSATNCPTPPCTQHALEFPSCRAKLLDKARSQAIGLGVIGVLFAVVQLLALFSAFCLLCCVKDDMDEAQA